MSERFPGDDGEADAELFYGDDTQVLQPSREQGGGEQDGGHELEPYSPEEQWLIDQDVG